MAVLKRYTVSFTPNTITSKKIVQDGKDVVTEVEYTINAYETANSSNTLTVTNQYITFNYFGKDTSSSSFVEIDDVNDSVVTQWLTEHFNDKELELNSLLTFEDTSYMPSSLDDIDLNNPYG